MLKDMKLTNDDISNIQKIVNYVNNYFQDNWDTFKATTIMQRKNYNKNYSRFKHMSYAISQNPKYDQLQSMKIGGDILANPTLTTSYDNNIIDNPTDLFKNECNLKRKCCFQGYEVYLTGMLYHYLYRTYGKGIPDNLDKYLDYRAIQEHGQHVFTDLTKWWNRYVGNRSMAEYAQNQNRIQAQKSKVQYIKDSKQRMNWLVKDNSFKRSSKRIIRVIKGSDDDGFSFDEQYWLGIKTINALFFWLTKYENLNIKPMDQLYQHYKLQKGTNDMTSIPAIRKVHLNQDDSFSITFESGEIASRVAQLLEEHRYKVLYPYYQHKVAHVPQYIQSRLERAIKSSTSTDNNLVNYNINKDYTKSAHGGYNVLILLKMFFKRYVQSITKDYLPYNFHNFAVPKSVPNIKEYWSGIQMGLRALDYEPIRDIQMCLNDRYAINPIEPKATYQDIHHNLNSSSYYRSMGVTNTVKEVLDEINRAIKKHVTVEA